MEKKDYLAQFDNIHDYMDAAVKDYFEEFGEEPGVDMRLVLYKVGLEYYEPERYERIFCS